MILPLFALFLTLKDDYGGLSFANYYSTRSNKNGHNHCITLKVHSGLLAFESFQVRPLNVCSAIPSDCVAVLLSVSLSLVVESIAPTCNDPK